MYRSYARQNHSAWAGSCGVEGRGASSQSRLFGYGVWGLGLPGCPCSSHRTVNVGLLVFLHRKCEPLERALLLVHLASRGTQTALLMTV